MTANDESNLLEKVAGAFAHDDSLERVLRLTHEHFGTTNGTIHVLGADGKLHLEASGDMPPFVMEKIAVIPVGKGMAGLAVERRAPVTTCNLQTDKTGDVRPGALQTGLQGSIVVPILRGEEPLGALGIANDHERTFSDDETRLLLEVGRRVAEHLAG